jgi:hypothetical protein
LVDTAERRGYACGRVIQLRIRDGKRDSRAILAGLMNWSDRELPTSDALAGCGVIEQGQAHIKTIRECGGAIQGFRDLALDGIEPQLSRDAWFATCVQRGFEILRPFDRAKDAQLPGFSAWGFGIVRMLAEKHFGGRH